MYHFHCCCDWSCWIRLLPQREKHDADISCGDSRQWTLPDAVTCLALVDSSKMYNSTYYWYVKFKLNKSTWTARIPAAALQSCYMHTCTHIYRVRIKNVPQKIAISPKLLNISTWNFLQLFMTIGCIKILSWNFISLHRNGNTWDTKFDFYKSPANNRDYIDLFLKNIKSQVPAKRWRCWWRHKLRCIVCFM